MNDAHAQRRPVLGLARLFRIGVGLSALLAVALAQAQPVPVVSQPTDLTSNADKVNRPDA